MTLLPYAQDFEKGKKKKEKNSLKKPTHRVIKVEMAMKKCINQIK